MAPPFALERLGHRGCLTLDDEIEVVGLLAAEEVPHRAPHHVYRRPAGQPGQERPGSGERVQLVKQRVHGPIFAFGAHIWRPG